MNRLLARDMDMDNDAIGGLLLFSRDRSLEDGHITLYGAFFEHLVCTVFDVLGAMVENFFAGRRVDGDETMMLISGPSGCGKSSLLFQFALNCALENSGVVVFICKKRKLETRPPCLSQGIDPSSEVFQRIQIKYVEDDEGIKKYFAAFHLHEIFPVAVIIDDFGNFFDDRNCQDRYGSQRGRDVAIARTLALCWDAISQANERLAEPCKLLLCDTNQGDGPRQLFIYKRWIPCIFTIKAEGDSSSSFTFTLKKNSTSTKRSGKERTAKYSIALQYLVLDEIIED